MAQKLPQVELFKSMPVDLANVKDALDALLAAIPDGSDEPQLKMRPKKLQTLIKQAIRRLRWLHDAVDPVSQPEFVFDPSDPQTVGKLIAETLIGEPRIPLLKAVNQKFYGSGVYALYFNGKFDAYRPLVGTDTPIYVGKSDPKTHDANSPEQQGVKLWDRLKDHRKSIDKAENLSVEDFDCRYLVVVSAWQNTAETYLIQRFMPIWDKDVGPCKGIGKHGDSPNTRSNTRSPWDTLHPGRTWAWAKGNKPNPMSIADIKKAIREHFKEHPPSENPLRA